MEPKIDNIIKHLGFVRSNQYNSRDSQGYNDFADVYAPVQAKRGIATRLTSTYGQLRQLNYVNFVRQLVFPQDGSWITYTPKNNDPESLQKAAEIEKYIRRLFKMSNFYNVASEIVDYGVERNIAYMQVEYFNGLSFRTQSPYNLYYDVNAAESLKSIFLESIRDSLSISELYMGEAVDDLFKSKDEKNPDVMSNQQIKVLECTLPLSKYFFEGEKPNVRYKYKNVTLIQGKNGWQEIKPINEDGEYLKTFPLVQYLPATKKSLTQIVYPHDRQIEELKDLIHAKTRYDVRPTVIIPDTMHRDGRYRHGASGLLPVKANERVPGTLPGSNQLSVAMKDLQDAKKEIDIAFKTKEIEMVKRNKNASFEMAHNKLMAIEAVLPHSADLADRMSTAVIQRAVSLVKSEDKELRKMIKETPGDFCGDGLTRETERLKRTAARPRAIQQIGPLLQGPGSLRFNQDSYVKEALEDLGLISHINSDDKVEKSKKQIMEQQKQKQANAEAEQTSKTASNLANAEATAAKAEGGGGI